MAQYYFDLNGATAGFGTLTGAWNTATANWSTNSAGTSATAAITFTNVDVANFGFTGTTATAGTATIATGVTVNLNGINTANLAGLQTIAATGTGALTFSGSSPTINVGSAGGLTITAPINGTGITLTKNGANSLNFGATSANGTLTGIFDITAGNAYAPASSDTTGLSAFVPNNANLTINIASGSIFQFFHSSAGASINVDSKFSGAGAVVFTPAGTGTGTYTFTTGALSSLTGTSIPSGGAITSGLGFFSNQGRFSSTFNVYDLPSNIGFNQANSADTTGTTQTLNYVGLGSSYSTQIQIYTFGTNATAITNTNFVINNNGSTNGLTLTGNVERYGSAVGIATLTLGGTSNGTLSGDIKNTVGVVALKKQNSGRWDLSGSASSFAGAVTVAASGGTLGAKSNTALGAAAGTASSIASGTTLEISGGVTLAKGSTAFTINGNGVGNAGAIYVPTGGGTNTFQTGAITLAASTTIGVEAGASLSMNGAIGGTFSLTKAAGGTLTLTATTSSYSGVNLISGTLAFSTIANGGVVSGIGAANNAASNIILTSGATLKYIGAAASTDRAFQVPAAGATLDGSGTGALTWGGAPTGTATNTAYALTLAGSASSGTNALSGALADNGTGAATLTNTGSWKLTGAASLTGALTASTGTLEVAPTTGANSMSGTAAAVTSGATLKLTTEAAVETPATGRVLGTKPVNVSGTLQTSTGTLQRGRMRYGGSVTFASGSTLRIGG